ncbi:efflux transporter outer membrane subunit [[Enterobacter] lignolyticus]|uniref:RND efflux system, outer membrane lipoprotein, NodT family n=2 Tax=[Enterobacter] lignolyticus TaxID=1334193 RepID=E3G887_ENTLS|nr:TolC family protein [[Enterobacter] lignolyticus]ADO49755.1 RND efflux system, outer membrane lipoprotein, NodT family [[Enterobacter] lignolyticus SCF1]ALR75569.1 RND transporter [[Enterobacter] lignolyticus]
MVNDGRLGRLLLTGGACLVLTACTKLGPDYTPPKTPELTQWQPATRGVTPHAAQASYDRWWTQLNDPTLTALVNEALRKNPDVKIAGLRLLESRAQLGIAESLLGPQATVGSGEIVRTGQVRDHHSSTATSYGAGFNLGWEIDFWGKFQRGVESADASYFATLAQYDDIQVLMAAQVAQLYVNIRTLEARLNITRNNADIQKRSLQITERLFLSGNSAELDVQQAKTQYLSTLSSIPQLETSLRQSQNALSVLLARKPGPLPEMASNTGVIPQGDLSLVSEVPADLLRRRPDVRTAERQLAAQSALIGVAESELYPSISLIGSVGISARTGSSSTLSWVAGPTFSWNLLDQGRLGNQVLVQDARFLQLHERYRDTVFQAAREVDDAAIAYANDKDEITLLIETGQAATRSLEIANTQYREGMADFQRVLDSQRALFNQQERLVNSRGAMMRDLITLYKALGGGWETGRQRPLVDRETESHLRQRDNWVPLLDTPLPSATETKEGNSP